jgi:hypothetical protein
VAIEMAVLELDPRVIGSLGSEADLDLAGHVRVRLELPAGADVPAEHDAVGWVVGEDPCPAALGPVLTAADDVAADVRLEHRSAIGDVRRLCSLGLMSP